jgi:hypothetical protein
VQNTKPPLIDRELARKIKQLPEDDEHVGEKAPAARDHATRQATASGGAALQGLDDAGVEKGSEDGSVEEKDSEEDEEEEHELEEQESEEEEELSGEEEDEFFEEDAGPEKASTGKGASIQNAQTSENVRTFQQE